MIEKHFVSKTLNNEEVYNKCDNDDNEVPLWTHTAIVIKRWNDRHS